MSASRPAGEAGELDPQAELPSAAEPLAEAAEPEPPAQPAQPAPLVIRRRGRRVSTEPPPGYTGEPPREREQSSENDARLKGDVPPHWG